MIALGAFLAGCSTTPREGPVTVPPSAGIYRIGKPYQIGDTWYYPREQPDYDETGIASWYGPNFAGQLTADGEIFDPQSLTAAHRTLPLPVNVRVTDLENGRSVILRVNDRGPFAKGRIIDVSAQAARLLGFYDKGTARVRVQFLARADLPNGEPQPFGAGTPSEITTAAAAAPTSVVEQTSLPPIPGAPVEQPQAQAPAAPTPPPPQTVANSAAGLPTGQVTQVPVPAATHLYIQVGAFSSYKNARRLADRLGGGLQITAVQRNGQTLYRVRLGPFDQTAQADAALTDMMNRGANDAQIVVDQ